MEKLLPSTIVSTPASGSVLEELPASLEEDFGVSLEAGFSELEDLASLDDGFSELDDFASLEVGFSELDDFASLEDFASLD